MSTSITLQTAPQGKRLIERFLLEEVPSLGPPPRGREGLKRAGRFFRRIGDPQNSTRSIHIVGTAGKGTAACATVGRLLGAGATVGAHLSPHVYDIRERFLLNGTLPTWAIVNEALNEIWPAVLEAEQVEGRPPSFFELTTALAWTIGRRAHVDVQVTEAGIGGEFDATNTIARTDKITAVMPIGYDHMEILGTDLAAIARSKVAVIPRGGQVVVAPQPHREALHVIEATARALDAQVHFAEPAAGPGPKWQAEAQAVAAKCVELLRAQGLVLDMQTTARPIAPPGRFQRMNVSGRNLILDGAHNPMKLRAVRESLGGRRPRVVVTALSHEKALDDCAAQIAELGDIVVATDFVVAAGDRVVRRSWSARQLAAAIHRARPATSVTAVPGIESAMADAMARTTSGDTILVTGSFMMLAPARQAALTTEAPANS